MWRVCFCVIKRQQIRFFARDIVTHSIAQNEIAWCTAVMPVGQAVQEFQRRHGLPCLRGLILRR